MRKLIVAGIITVLIIIGCFIYFEYDRQKFEKEMSQGQPPSKQQVNSTAKDSNDTSVDDEGKTDQSVNENTPSFSQEETPQDGGQSNEIDGVTGREGDDLDPDKTLSDNRFSPELIKVFTEIRPIYKEMEEIVSELAPLNREMHKIMKRKQNVFSEINTITDPDEKWKLSEEYQSLTKLEQETGSEMLKLQDKLKPYETELKRILSEHGFQSQREFEKTHHKSYKTWVSGQ